MQSIIKKPDIKTAFVDSKDSYNELKGKLDKLEKYKKTSEYGKLISDDKKAFDSLLEKVKERIDELTVTHKEGNGSPTNDETPFFKTA